MFSLLFLLVEFSSTVHSLELQVIYWELKPYIWVNNGTLDGILPFILEKASTLCSTKKNNVTVSYSVNLLTLINFERVLASEKPKYGKGKLSNITKDTKNPVVWFPYPVSIRKKENNPIHLRGLKIYNFVYASSISIIMSQDHIAVSRKILYGVYTCTPLLLQLFFCSIIAAITIWLAERGKNPNINQSFVQGTGMSL